MMNSTAVVIVLLEDLVMLAACEFCLDDALVLI